MDRTVVRTSAGVRDSKAVDAAASRSTTVPSPEAIAAKPDAAGAADV